MTVQEFRKIIPYTYINTILIAMFKHFKRHKTIISNIMRIISYYIGNIIIIC